jgi:predicted tellurium resistance membrane protein TerC
MAQKQFKKREAAKPLSSSWDAVLGVLATLLVFVVPFFPDEKLIRPKMQVLELGLFGLVLIVGLRIFLTSRFPLLIKKSSSSFHLLLSIGAWVVVQTILFVMAVEKSLAGNELRRVFPRLERAAKGADRHHHKSQTVCRGT